MFSKVTIEDESKKELGTNIATSSMFTGTVDTWLTPVIVGSGSSVTALAGTGIIIKAGLSALNNSAEISTTFSFVPANYRKITIINVFQGENIESSPLNYEHDIGIFNTGNTNFLQILFHLNVVRTRVGGVTRTAQPALLTGDTTKKKHVEFVWNVAEGFIEVYENHLLIYRFTGDDIPDRTNSYTYKQKVISKTVTNDKFIKCRDISIELEL